MSEKNTGGPAFPVPDSNGTDYIGMTLRDYLAAKALPLVAPGHCDLCANVVWVRPVYFAGLAADAYALADAMLHAREA